MLTGGMGTWCTFAASSLQSLQWLVRQAAARLQLAGFTVNASKSCWTCSGLRLPHSNLLIGDAVVPHNPAGLPFLGVEIPMSGRTGNMVQQRIHSTKGYVVQRLPFLKARGICRALRLCMLWRMALPVLMWGSECWQLTASELRAIRKAQNAMCLWVLGYKMQPNEVAAAFCNRRYRGLRTMLQDLHLKPWPQTALERQFTWAGHVMTAREDGCWRGVRSSS